MAENLAWLCVGLFPICVALWLPIALIAIMGGLAGLAADRRRKGTMWLVSLFALGVGACMLLVLVRNRFFPEPSSTPVPVYKITDEAAKPFLQTISQSNRLSLGFSPIPPDAKVKIYEYGSEVDVYISVGPETGWGEYTSWHVSIAKVNNTYKWVGESEVHAGPHRYENIYISYCTNSKAIQPNTLVVEYRGEDPRLKRPNLTLQDVRPVLAEWKKAWAMSTPEK
ncbi:MAG: hypothetical protein ACETWR_05610 [Anaerolineae bacterium]